MQKPTVFACLLVLAAAPAFGQGGAASDSMQSPQQLDGHLGSITGMPRATFDFGDADADRDGFLSRNEAELAGFTGNFAEIDQNLDGRLDQAEFDALSEPAGFDVGGSDGMRTGTSDDVDWGPSG